MWWETSPLWVLTLFIGIILVVQGLDALHKHKGGR